MTDSIPVVDEAQAREYAYGEGYGRFEKAIGPIDLASFISSAAYANKVLPDLRARAGYDDAGHGTYQVDREVALIPEDHPDAAEPAEAVLVDASNVLETLVASYHDGAHDAVGGDE